MTQEEKDLLLNDLCARLRCGVKIKIGEHSDYTLYSINPNVSQPITVSLIENEIEYPIDISIEHIKPYLRPMSSMTEEEEKECIELSRTIIIPHVRNWFGFSITNPIFTDWLNSHHFDYRNLIEKGLALEAPEDMYKTE